MIEIYDEESLYDLGKALSSQVRIQIIQMLINQGGMNLNELAEKLNITSSAMTSHINLLEKAGILSVESTSGKRGTQKKCYITEHRILLDLHEAQRKRNTFVTELPIGSYIDYKVKPTCGIATTKEIIGSFDKPKYFDDPSRIYAGILWLTEGYVEYRLPNYIESNQRIKELQITQELSSEAPGFCEDWPSQIYFSINGMNLCSWLCPGDFGLRTGLYSPDWWIYGNNQYGMLKVLVINEQGTYLDGQLVNALTIKDLNIEAGTEIRYRISAPDNGVECGGLTIYGKGFGNYNQSLGVQMLVEDN